MNKGEIRLERNNGDTTIIESSNTDMNKKDFIFMSEVKKRDSQKWPSIEDHQISEQKESEGKFLS